MRCCHLAFALVFAAKSFSSVVGLKLYVRTRLTLGGARNVLFSSLSISMVAGAPL